MTPCDMGSEAAERYVAGAMTEPERTGFEQHFFACDVCFQAVQALEDARELLAGTETGQIAQDGGAASASGRGLPLKWMALAATLVLSVMVWQMSRPTDVPAETVASISPPAAPPTLPVAPAPAPDAQVPSPAARPAAPRTSATLENRLERWAAVIPPQYVALTTRSELDKEAQAFDEAMVHYSAGHHRHAADALQVLAERSPTAAHVHFFLGISELMSGNVARARGALQRSAEAGVSPYSDEAHFYLAKVALRAGDLTTATQELEVAVAHEAGPDGDAVKLLAELRAVGK